MSALVLDAGALVAVERDDRRTVVMLRTAHRSGFSFRTHAMIVAQVWREPAGRQVKLARFLRGVEIDGIDAAAGRAAGELLGAAGTSDPIDAALVLVADPGDRIVTGDVEDIGRLVDAARARVAIVDC